MNGLEGIGKGIVVIIIIIILFAQQYNSMHIYVSTMILYELSTASLSPLSSYWI